MMDYVIPHLALGKQVGSWVVAIYIAKVQPFCFSYEVCEGLELDRENVSG